MSNSSQYSGYLSQEDFKTFSTIPVDIDSHDSPVYLFLFKKNNGRLGRVVLTLDDFGTQGKDNQGKNYRYEVVDPFVPYSVSKHLYSSTKQGALKKGLYYCGVRVLKDEK